MDTEVEKCIIRATAATGLEFAALAEAKEKFKEYGVERFCKNRGHILCEVPVAKARECLELRVVDHLQVVIGTFEIEEWNAEISECIKQIEDLLDKVDWSTGLKVWSDFHKEFPHAVGTEKYARGDESGDTIAPRYRVTCWRTGQNHCFSSQDMAHKLGGDIGDRFGWKVNLKEFDIEVVIDITENTVKFIINLTTTGLFYRNIKHFARTTLRATICAGLIRIAGIKPGDVVLDPMCGTAGISIEGALTHADSFHIAADNQHYCVECSINNITDLNEDRKSKQLGSLNLAAMCWDATHLPLVDSCVDAIVTDMPFGKRMGNKVDNRKLYPAFLTEAARVTRPSTGRAVLLTADRRCMARVLPAVKKWWVVPQTHFINHGGIRAGIYYLRRTAKLW